MDSRSTASLEAGRKRPSNLIRACWECKKRRLQSNSSQNDSASTINMEAVQPEGEDNACPIHIGERLSKLEQLFEKFVCRKPSSAGTAPVTPPSSNPSSKEKRSEFVGLPQILSDAQSITSIGDGILAAQNGTWSSAPSIRTLVDKCDTNGAACDTIHRALTALLPSQHDADVIFESSNGWMILNGIYKPAKDIFVNKDPSTYALDMTAIAQERTIIVARTIVHLAVCISSLPPEFDVSRLHNIWGLDSTMENYVNAITSLITSSDEPLLTLPGLETLLLLAIYNMNIANLRQAWLIARRAMNLAHLMGFHRIVTQRTPAVDAIESAASIWRGLVDLDRLLGLHLRLPFAADDYPVIEDADPHLIHRSRLATICRQICELDREVNPQSYVQALALDEKLESMMKEQPRCFWEVPNVPPTARTTESNTVLERLMVQMWHFELKIFIHLPFLLRASKESRYEYSKVTALQASRNIVMRYFALRNAGITQACCRFGELGVFIAAVTLTLDILIEMATKEKSEVQKTKGSDFTMICRLITEMEKLGKESNREKIAARSAIVLKKILSSLDPSKRNMGKARLTLPYFGTIEMDFKKLPVRPAFDLDSDIARKLNSTPTGQHLPVFSFVSNALWPASNDDENYELDFDIVLFDGLQDLDVDGNWVF